MKNMDRVIVGSLLVLGLGLSLGAHACTTDGWLGGTNGIPANGDAGSPLTVSRYSELCALAITDTSWVQSDLASDKQYIGRFYVYPDLTGSGLVDLLVAYSDEGGASPLFKISYNGSQFVFDTDGAGGGTDNADADDGWNLIEFEYDADNGNFNYWVNETWGFASEAYVTGPTSNITFPTSTVKVESVRLGAPNGMDSFAGTITYDAFEAHRTTAVGALRAGDANSDDVINILDLGKVRLELLNPGIEASLAEGTPDCNNDGSINILDVGCVRLILLNPEPDV